MHAGPAADFPTVSRLAAGLRITIHGCVHDWSWCDVEWRGTRGWLPASAVDLRFDESRLPVSAFGERAGLPEVEFKVGQYWDAHYRDRPWYADRSVWAARVAFLPPERSN